MDEAVSTEQQDAVWVVNGVEVRPVASRGKRMAAVVVVAILLTAFLPRFVFADWPPSDADHSTNLLNVFSTEVTSLGRLDDYTSDFDSILGYTQTPGGGLIIVTPGTGAVNTNGTRTIGLASIAESISKTAIFPVACVMFSIALLAQLMKVAQRMAQDNGPLPGVKDVLFLFVWAAIGVYVLGHSFGLIEDIYDITTGFIKQLQVNQVSFTFQAESVMSDMPTDFMDLMGKLLQGIAGTLAATVFTPFLVVIGTGVVMVIAIIVKVAYIARGVQIYLYAIFAPLMLSLIMWDELRPWSMGYLKGFLAVCLAGFIMVFATMAYPYVLLGMLGSSAVAGGAGAFTVTIDSNYFQILGEVIAAGVALATLMTNSGKYAREIIGG